MSVDYIQFGKFDIKTFKEYVYVICMDWKFLAEKFFGGGDILLVEQKKNLRGVKGEKMLGVAGEGARVAKETRGARGARV